MRSFTLNTMSEVRPLRKNRTHNCSLGAATICLPTALGVCSLLCVCVHLDGLNAEHKFRVWVIILGHKSLHFTSVVHVMPAMPRPDNVMSATPGPVA